MAQDSSFYPYSPSLAAAALFSALYGLAFLATFFQWLRLRAWVWIVVVLAAIMETIGYIARCISMQHDTNKSLYVLQFAMIVLPPVLIAAGCYIVFGRILFLVVPREERTLRLCWVPPRFVTPIFVAFDIVALLLQLAGAVMIASTVPGEKDAASKLEHGKHIAQAGVVIQLLAFGLFAVAAIRFNFTSRPYAQTLLERYAADADEKTILIDGKRRRKHWQALLRVVNVTSVLILVRTVYRLVQFSEGKTGYINLHEWTMYVFDAAVVYPCVILFIWWHPAYYLPHLGFSLKD